MAAECIAVILKASRDARSHWVPHAENLLSRSRSEDASPRLDKASQVTERTAAAKLGIPLNRRPQHH